MLINLFSKDTESQAAQALSQAYNVFAREPYSLNENRHTQMASFQDVLAASYVQHQFRTSDGISFDLLDFIREMTNTYINGGLGNVDAELISDYMVHVANDLVRDRAAWVSFITFFTGKNENKTVAQISPQDPSSIARLVKEHWTMPQAALKRLKKLQSALTTSEQATLQNFGYRWVEAQAKKFAAASGWVTGPLNEVYSIPVVPTYPTKKDLIAIQTFGELYQVLKAFDTVDWSAPIKFTVTATSDIAGSRSLGKSNADKSKVKVSAQALATTVLHLLVEPAQATDTRRLGIDLFKTMMFCTSERWMPLLNSDVEFRAAMEKNEHAAKWSRNLTLFAIHQDMVADANYKSTLPYTVSVLAGTIIPAIARNMMELSPYKTVPLAEHLAGITAVYSRNHRQEPTLIHLTDANQLIQNDELFETSRINEHVFMNGRSELSNRLSAIANDVRRGLDPLFRQEAIVSLHEEQNVADRMNSKGTEIVIDLPVSRHMIGNLDLPVSLLTAYVNPESSTAKRTQVLILATLLQLNSRRNSSGGLGSQQVTYNLLVEKFVKSNDGGKVRDLNDISDIESTEDLPDSITADPTFIGVSTQLERIRDSYYHLVLALAVHTADSTHFSYDIDIEGLGTTEDRADEHDWLDQNIHLLFDKHTSLIEPLGHSAILDGLVRTTEPVEVILYAKEIRTLSPVKREVVAMPNLSAQRYDTDHRWNYSAISRNSAHTGIISVTVAGTKIQTTLTERHILNTADTLAHVMRTRNPFLSMELGSYLSNTKELLEHLTKRIATLKTDPETSRDNIIAYEGMMRAILRQFLDYCMGLAASPAGVNLMREVKATIRRTLKDNNAIIAPSHLQTAAFRTSTSIQIAKVIMEFAIEPRIHDVVKDLIHIANEMGSLADLVSSMRVAEMKQQRKTLAE